MITEDEFKKRIIAHYEDKSLWARPETEELRSLIKELIDFTLYPLDDVYLNGTIASNILRQLDDFKKFHCLDLTAALLSRYSPFILVYISKDEDAVQVSKGVDIYWMKRSEKLKDSDSKREIVSIFTPYKITQERERSSAEGVQARQMDPTQAWSPSMLERMGPERNMPERELLIKEKLRNVWDQDIDGTTSPKNKPSLPDRIKRYIINFWYNPR